LKKLTFRKYSKLKKQEKMKNLGKFLNDALLSTVKSSFEMLDATQRLFNEFDSEAFSKSVIDRKNSLLVQGNEWLNRMNDFFKEVKDTVTAFTVTVPFEAGKDTINLSVDNGILTIVTEYQGKTTTRKSTNTVTLPKDCDVERMTHTVNKDKGTATVIIPKKASETSVDSKLQKQIDDARAKAKETVKFIKKTFDEAVEDGKKIVEEAKKARAVKKVSDAVKPKAPKATEPKAEAKKVTPKAKAVKKAEPKAKKATAVKADKKKK
jgi:hypothetical protein